MTQKEYDNNGRELDENGNPIDGQRGRKDDEAKEPSPPSAPGGFRIEENNKP